MNTIKNELRHFCTNEIRMLFECACGQAVIALCFVGKIKKGKLEIVFLFNWQDW
jgi:hypothetical protein